MLDLTAADTLITTWSDKYYFNFWRPWAGVTDEVLEARIWAGIHFRTADVQAADLGREIARYIHTHFFAAAH